MGWCVTLCGPGHAGRRTKPKEPLLSYVYECGGGRVVRTWSTLWHKHPAEPTRGAHEDEDAGAAYAPRRRWLRPTPGAT